MKNIRLITTGGTFDKKYDAIQGKLDFKETHLPEILEIVRPNARVEIENRALIDSLEMTDEIREQIIKSCVDSPEKNIIITHGTDTMSRTAELLGEAAAYADSGLSEKTIILTGAMVPYTISGSDALFNLGTAFTAVQLLKPGVYIVMNATVFDWNNVRKNKAIGRFEQLK
ncbi:MAG: asparaginase domain-containing protein [Spirochaetales bacterium]|uniref:Asparaginase domain-containing protein n=1 Tax=Candidatus Thalassospirochaeta sargassi TaxID=3119039 RepID=A0AAJ1IDF9_9SPIO|nr:asparaginase domain-containing protein [Spirochaetales bacterium]